MKNKMISLWRLFFNCGVSNSEYSEVRPTISERNRETLILSSLMCTILFACLMAGSFVSAEIAAAVWFYTVMANGCAMILIIAFTMARSHEWIVLPLWYLLFLLFGIYAVLLNTMIRPELSSTTLCVFLVAGPLLIIDRPVRVMGFVAGLSLTFHAASTLYKSEAVAFADNVNVLSCLFMGTAIYIRLVRVKVREIIQSRILERERDTDKLTGLYNKAASEREIRRLLDIPRQKGAMIVMDVDDFKHINDTYGHAFGDVILCQVAGCIRDIVGQGNICGRFGGDEFVICVSGCDREWLFAALDALCKRISEELRLPDPEDLFHVSIGAVMIPDHGTQYEQLFQNADQALYEAKKAGKNQWKLGNSGNSCR